MVNYNYYTYSKLLYFLHEGYKKYPTFGNYAEHLLSMKEANSIVRMIEIYDRVVYIIPYYLYGPDNIPNDWFLYEKWKDNSSYLAYELNSCLNESILSFYRSITNPPEHFRYSCIVNLRHCKEMNAMEMAINDSSNNNINEIRTAKQGIFNRRLLPYTPQNKYSKSDLKRLYNQDMEVLTRNGYVKTIVDKQYEEANHYCPSTSKTKKRINKDYLWIALSFLIALITIIPLTIFIDSIGGFLGLMLIIGISGFFLSGAWKK